MRAFLAVSVNPSADGSPPRRGPDARAMAYLGEACSAVHTGNGRWVAFAGPDPDDMVDDTGRFTVRLGRTARTRDGDVGTPALAAMLGDGDALDGEGLTALLPPFAAAHCAGPDRPVVVAADWLGFRQLFWWQGDAVAAVSTSATALAALTRADHDLGALGVQSLVGWQIGTGTVFRGVTKLAPGCAAVLADGRVDIRRYRADGLALAEPPPLPDAVDEMARILIDLQTAYLTDHPATVLQLTGGHDSRILLGAVPPARRAGLHTLTLGECGALDVTIAAALSARFGMCHQVYRLDEQPIEPATAYRLALDAAVALDCMASPLALAPLALAESRLPQGHRLSGLGGEVARGFYYGGQPRNATTGRPLVERLAQWRLFANEAAAADALDPDFVAQARSGTCVRLHELFDGYSRDWLRATDEFYLFQRVHRWAGAHGTVATTGRAFVNPMFDRRFLALALAVHPDDKRDSHLLGRLMCRLDPVLAGLPLDSGMVPARLARRGAANTATVARLKAARALAKVRQRVAGTRRPQTGVAGMAGLVLAHWRAQPDSAAALRRSGIVREAWLDELLDGRREAEPTTVAFLVNLLVATEAATAGPPPGPAAGAQPRSAAAPPAPPATIPAPRTAAPQPRAAGPAPGNAAAEPP